MREGDRSDHKYLALFLPLAFDLGWLISSFESEQILKSPIYNGDFQDASSISGVDAMVQEAFVHRHQGVLCCPRSETRFEPNSPD